MPTYYLHTMLAYEKISKLNLSNQHCSAFLLGAIAPDAVPVGTSKRRTHYNIHFGITWGYRFKVFETEFSCYRQLSTNHQWFYEGYKYHLNLDYAWVKACLNRAILRLTFNNLTRQGKRKKAQYYEEMGQFDDFHRASINPEQQQEIYEHLISADFNLLPKFIDRDRLWTILSHLHQTSSRTAPFYDGQLLRGDDIVRFMCRVSSMEIE